MIKKDKERLLELEEFLKRTQKTATKFGITDEELKALFIELHF